MRQNKYEYDAFISHAVEDKIPIANELCARLERAGLRIWYSGKELGIGDSIEKTIARGLNRSRYGIVIFSPTYLAKNWTIREFYTLLAKEIEQQKVILPVLYNITLDELKNKDLVMADRFAVNADSGIDYVVDRLVAEIKRPAREVKKKEAWFSRMWLILAISLLANVALLLKSTVFTNSTGEIQALSTTETERITRHDDYPATLFGEIRGLLTEMSSCGHETGHGQAMPYRTAFATNAPRFPTSETEYDAPQAQEIGRAHNAGKKVTMAIVFQIESAGSTPPPIEREMDEIFQTISLRGEEEEGPLVVLEKPSGPAAGHRFGCVRAGATN